MLVLLHVILLLSIYACRIAVLLFLEIAVSRIAVPVSPYRCRRIGAT